MDCKLIVILTAICLIPSCGTPKKAVLPEAATAIEDEQDVSPNTLIIMYDTEIGKEPLQKGQGGRIRGARLEEIELRGKPVSFRKVLQKSKKAYDRKKFKQVFSEE